MARGRAATVACLAFLACVAVARAGAEEPPYRTPRAGEGFEADLFGKRVSVPRRDRRSTRALTLGGAYFDPTIAGTSGSPLFNVYWRRYWDDRRLYGLFSGFYDHVEYGEHLAATEARPRTYLEAVAIFENFTIPEPLTAILPNGREADGAEVWWGRISLDLGPGTRSGIPPFEVDNALQLAVFAHIQWDYFVKDDRTTPGAIVPRDTYTYGGRLILRLDALERNLLELPHLGVAGGVTVDLWRRGDWRPTGQRGPDGARLEPRPDTRDIVRVAGYAYAAFGVPLLSERHRLVAQVHGGWAPPGTLDRFSAFRFGAGPYQSESYDLGRVAFSLVTFEELTADRYFVVGLTYRYEALFFLYPHARVQWVWGRFGEWDDARWDVRFGKRSAWLYSVGVTTGFAFKSQIMIDYTYGDGLFRGGREGHGVLFMWSKSF